MRDLCSVSNLPLCVCIFPFPLSYSRCVTPLEQALFPTVFVQHIVEQGLSMLYKQLRAVKYRCRLLLCHRPTEKVYDTALKPPRSMRGTKQLKFLWKSDMPLQRFPFLLFLTLLSCQMLSCPPPHPSPPAADLALVCGWKHGDFRRHSCSRPGKEGGLQAQHPWPRTPKFCPPSSAMAGGSWLQPSSAPAAGTSARACF